MNYRSENLSKYHNIVFESSHSLKVSGEKMRKFKKNSKKMNFNEIKLSF